MMWSYLLYFFLSYLLMCLVPSLHAPSPPLPPSCMCMVMKKLQHVHLGLGQPHLPTMSLMKVLFDCFQSLTLHHISTDQCANHACGAAMQGNKKCLATIRGDIFFMKALSKVVASMSKAKQGLKVNLHCPLECIYIYIINAVAACNYFLMHSSMVGHNMWCVQLIQLNLF